MMHTETGETGPSASLRHCFLRQSEILYKTRKKENAHASFIRSGNCLTVRYTPHYGVPAAENIGVDEDGRITGLF